MHACPALFCASPHSHVRGGRTARSCVHVRIRKRVRRRQQLDAGGRLPCRQHVHGWQRRCDPVRIRGTLVLGWQQQLKCGCVRPECVRDGRRRGHLYVILVCRAVRLCRGVLLSSR